MPDQKPGRVPRKKQPQFVVRVTLEQRERLNAEAAAMGISAQTLAERRLFGDAEDRRTRTRGIRGQQTLPIEQGGLPLTG